MKEVTLEDKHVLRDITKAVIKAKRVVIVSGAGVSTAAGIPDFRSKHGLYNKSTGGPAIFSASVYRSQAGLSDHLVAMSSLHASTSQAQPTATHRFVKQLDRKSKLLRNYTQNIDMLEAKAGLDYVDLVNPPDPASTTDTKKRKRGAEKNKGSVVQLHGNVHSVRCSVCSYVDSWSDIDTAAFSSGHVRECPSCEQEAETRARLSKRKLTKPSFVRPNVALYDEEHRQAGTIGDVIEADLSSKPDLLIVMGTALKVNGAKRLVKDLAKAVRARQGKTIRIDLAQATSEWFATFDWHVTGSCDHVTTAIVNEWKKTRPQDWQIQPSVSSMILSNKTNLTTSTKTKV